VVCVVVVGVLSKDVVMGEVCWGWMKMRVVCMVNCRGSGVGDRSLWR
jgi:hypothetical protein